MSYKSIVFLCFSFLLSVVSHAQSQLVLKENLDWAIENIQNINAPGSKNIFTCSSCSNNYPNPTIPVFTKRIGLESNVEVSLKLVNLEIVKESQPNNTDVSSLKNDFIVKSKVFQNRKDFFLNIQIVPIRKVNGQIEKLKSFDIEINLSPKSFPPITKDPTTTVSKLNSGDIYKVAVSSDGMYKITSSDLSNLGINVNSINPKNIQVLGHGGGPLAQSLQVDRIDDLEELAIEVTGENDGSFDADDEIHFYAEGPDKRSVDSEGNYSFTKNIYENKNYYFIKIGGDEGKRILTQNSLTGSDVYTFTDYDYFVRYEEDITNLLGAYGLTQGSGKQWYGDKFSNVRERDYSNFFSIPSYVAGAPAKLQVAFAARSGSSSLAQVLLDNNLWEMSFTSTQVEDVESIYARRRSITRDFSLISANPKIEIKYPDNGNSNEGWLDYIELSTRRTLNMLGNQMIFSDTMSRNFTRAAFSFSGNPDIDIWDITDHHNVKKLNNTTGNGPFIFDTQGLTRSFMANNKNSYLNIETIGLVSNQNLHGIENVEFVIIHHPDFLESATKLAEHRSNINPLNTITVDINQVYNEFSSGRIDPTAIRDFSKMLYDRSDDFKYLLLFGDGTYDYKELMPDVPFGNYIPTYQTDVSLDPVEGFPSDDYYALLNDQEGADLTGEIDIAVGRIPVKNTTEANAVVSKIIHYETNSATYGDWRLKLLFNADDQDGNTHLNQADDISNRVLNQAPVYNIQKNFFDAYQQISTPGGDRFPDATEALNKAIQSGVLVTNYLGHGGSKGWAQERVLKVTDIQNYTNFDKLTTMVTATCSFTGYDDPALNTGGELCLTQPGGGAVALLTTTRAVYVSGNRRLTQAVFDTIFTKDNGSYLRIGEVMRRAKNSNSADTSLTNARKFAMIGDPTLKLAIPEYDIFTTSVNGVPVNNNAPDTIRALQLVTIEGFVANFDGSVNTDFNGTIYPTVYDKKSTIETLNNDNGTAGTKKFQVFKNIIFKGAASVNQGKWTFSFVVPKDIDYSFGYGKISLYATDNNSKDAAGFYNDIVIGGTDPNAIIDDKGPVIQLFMDDLSFEFGDITNKNTTLIAKISDDFGINITGTSIGHDLTGVLDENENESFILNEYYNAEIDDYTSGTVEFPLEDLELGLHTLRVKAWDISNNSAEETTEFTVVDSEQSALDHVLNYPNPFTTSTNFRFTTELKNVQLDVVVNIFTVSGKLVKSIPYSGVAIGGSIDDIFWNGRDDFESPLAKGVYLYKIKVRSDQLDYTEESDYEKLVILK